MKNCSIFDKLIAAAEHEIESDGKTVANSSQLETALMLWINSEKIVIVGDSDDSITKT